MAIVTASDWNPVQSKIVQVLSTPNGTTTNLGYNTTYTSGQVAGGNTITGAQWNALRSDINKAYKLQTGSDSDLTTRGNTDAITQADLTTISARADTAYNNRTSVNVAQLNYQECVSGSRSNAWSSFSYADPYLVWANNDTYRGFWNGGGFIAITSSRSGGSVNSQNTSWTNLLSNMGTIIISRTSCYQSGQTWNGTFSVSNGAYGGTLDTLVRQVFRITGQDTNYTTNSFEVVVSLGTADPKTNTQVNISLGWNDTHTPLGAGPDTVNGDLYYRIAVYYPFGNSVNEANQIQFTQTAVDGGTNG